MYGCVLVLDYVSFYLTQLEKKWAQKLEAALKEKQNAKSTETQDGSCQTNTVDSVTQLLSLEQLEDRLGAQRVALQQESNSKLAEAVRNQERELQQKHVEDTTLQVCFTQHCSITDLLFTFLSKYC